jgi:cytochrome P450
LFYRLTMDSSTEFFFGESSHSLMAEQESAEARFVGAFDRGQHYVGQRASMGPYYWLKTNAQFRKDCRTVHDWTDACVDRALRRYNERQKRDKGDIEGDGGQYIFLDELIAQTQDRVALRSQLLNVLIAGRDTTAGLMSWVFLHLSRRPEYFQELRTALIDTFGTYEEPRDITFATLKACKPLQNLLKETLRLHPGVPTNIRQALKDTTLPTGGGPSGTLPLFVPKDSQVFYNVYWMHRDKTYWGDDADDFKPERWETVKPSCEYLPFNGGPRICLGQMFALTSAGYTIVRMLQRFDGVRTTDWGELKVNVSLTASSATGVHLSLHRTEDK